MSATNHTQANNKKGSQQNGPGVNAVTNTAAQTPNSNGNMAPQQQLPPPSQSTSPPANNAPKYGTLVPNRVFVGGIAANTTEGELAQLFSAYGTVKATKIISDRAGVSKGYGFVTFESEEEAKRLQRESDNIMLRERRLNIAPAIKKQPFNRSFDVPSPPPNAAAQTQFYYTAAAAGGVPYAYQNGMAYYTSPPQTTCTNGDPTAAHTVYQAPPVYATPTAAPPTAPYPMPLYPPQPLFVHQQYPYQAIPQLPDRTDGTVSSGAAHLRSTRHAAVLSHSTLRPIKYDMQHFYGSSGHAINGPSQYVYGSGINSSNGGSGSAGTGINVVSQSNVCGSTNAFTPVATATTGADCIPNGITTIPARLSHATTTYYQHLTCNTPDGMYYNMPVFNVTIDPSGNIYTESVDGYMGNNSEAITSTSTIGTASVNLNSPHFPGGVCSGVSKTQESHCQQNISHNYNHINSKNQQPYGYGYVVPIGERNGYLPPTSDKLTPVVSLLSVGQASERDYRSMQSGRKHRQPNSATETSSTSGKNNSQALPISGIQSLRITGPSMSYICSTTMNGYSASAPSNTKLYHRRNDKCESSQCKTWSRKRRGYNGSAPSTDNSSAPSIRTSSNSSANAVFDENLNEKKDKSLSDTSPPSPATFSPMQRSEGSRPLIQSTQCRTGTGNRRVRRTGHQRKSPTQSTATPQEITLADHGSAAAPTNLNRICEKVDSNE